jgi:hypothetical protein
MLTIVSSSLLNIISYPVAVFIVPAPCVRFR